jgi:hypothetical protein
MISPLKLNFIASEDEVITNEIDLVSPGEIEKSGTEKDTSSAFAPTIVSTKEKSNKMRFILDIVEGIY